MSYRGEANAAAAMAAAAAAGAPGSGVAAQLDVAVGGLLESSLTSLWLLQMAFLVFFMQCGFALLEAGAVRPRGLQNILLKNVANAVLSALVWWGVGYSFAFSRCGVTSAFAGADNFFFSKAAVSAAPHFFSGWLFSWAFASTAATIASGAMAERTRLPAYLVFTAAMTGAIYPLVNHWVWSRRGWLSGRRIDCTTLQPDILFSHTQGLLDFAGSGVVHMTGGAAALAGAATIGPRLGRFNRAGLPIAMAHSNPAHMAVGTFILWLGWFAFNTGSTACVSGCMDTAAQVAVNTALAASAGGATALVTVAALGHPGDIAPLLNGILAGAVSITAACAYVQAYAAVLIGTVGGLVYVASSQLLRRLQVDDPLDAAPVHLFCGAWGLLAAGLFATETGVARAARQAAAGWGVLYGGPGAQLGLQLLGIAVIGAWSLATSAAIFWALRAAGLLRLSKDAELGGPDDHPLHGGAGDGILGNGVLRAGAHTAHGSFTFMGARVSVNGNGTEAVAAFGRANGGSGGGGEPLRHYSSDLQSVTEASPETPDWLVTAGRRSGEWSTHSAFDARTSAPRWAPAHVRPTAPGGSAPPNAFDGVANGRGWGGAALDSQPPPTVSDRTAGGHGAGGTGARPTDGASGGSEARVRAGTPLGAAQRLSAEQGEIQPAAT